jgi:predicted alpha/beta superfamily hydrolase
MKLMPHRFRFLLVIALLWGLPAFAQLTITITSVPANTPAQDPIYLAGSFNSWNPAAAAYRFTAQPGGQYTLTLPTTVRGAVEFKLTRGSWATVESTASGSSIPNRTFTVPATGAATYAATVAGWEDLLAPPPVSTASPSVSVLSTSFAIPQLGRTRRIWLYLPPDYATSTKTYPVLYMHDGQNLFDNLTSFSGEWGVDEALDQLQAQGDWGCIVVGIDNGGAARLDEYSPYVNPQYGGGQGDQYVDFLVNTLKPYIDQHYRTRPDRLSTGVMGSSMGGLISLYAALKRPDVFGRSGVFSPSLWFNRRIYSYARAAVPQRPDTRMYLLSGGRESATQARDQRLMVDTLAAAGFRVGTELDSVIKSDGQHAEWFWKREFPAAYQWLFAGTGPLATSAEIAQPTLELFPNPGDSAHDELTIQLPTPADASGRVPVELLDATGRVVARGKMRRGRTVIGVRGLAAGVYTVRVELPTGPVSRRWLKQ